MVFTRTAPGTIYLRRSFKPRWATEKRETMKKGLFITFAIILIIGVLVGFAYRKGHAAPEMKHIVLTADQSKPLAEIVDQLKQIDQQASLLKAKAGGIVQVYAEQGG